MGFGAKSLGRKQFSRNKAQNLWLVCGQSDIFSPGERKGTVVSNEFNPGGIVTFQNPFKINFTVFASYKGVFNGTAQFLQVRVGFGSSWDNLIDEFITHSTGGGCGSVPDLMIEKSFFGEFSNPIKIDLDAGGSGGTICDRKITITMLIQGTLTGTDFTNNLVDWTVKKIS